MFWTTLSTLKQHTYIHVTEALDCTAAAAAAYLTYALHCSQQVEKPTAAAAAKQLCASEMQTADERDKALRKYRQKLQDHRQREAKVSARGV